MPLAKDHRVPELPYDALLVVSFGGPERPEDVLPFLENVLRGKNVPRERMLKVAEHYHHCGGRSPINDQNRQLIAALTRALDARGPRLPIYWGNRNWHPLLPDVLRQMASDGRRRALAFFTSAYSSYSGCRQYRENIADAQQAVGPAAPRVDKLRVFYNHPLFIEVMTDRVTAALEALPAASRDRASLVFTAHSIPASMAATSQYEAQLREACALVAQSFPEHAWQLAFQSRSGPPHQPWLAPDVCDALRHLASHEARDVVVVPIGFLSDHLEVLYDLDVEVRRVADELGLTMIRAGTAGADPKFVEMIRELILERLEPNRPRRAIGTRGASHDECPTDCCPRPGK